MRGGAICCSIQRQRRRVRYVKKNQHKQYKRTCTSAKEPTQVHKYIRTNSGREAVLAQLILLFDTHVARVPPDQVPSVRSAIGPAGTRMQDVQTQGRFFIAEESSYLLPPNKRVCVETLQKHTQQLTAALFNNSSSVRDPYQEQLKAILKKKEWTAKAIRCFLKDWVDPEQAAAIDRGNKHSNGDISQPCLIDLLVQYWCDHHISALEASAVVPPA